MKFPPCVLLLLTTACLAGIAAAAPLISEIAASNETSAFDTDGEAPDWLEIYNPDATPANLGGWHLTDDALDFVKWTFPAGTVVEPGGFLRVWASGKDRKQDAAQLHTNFSLSASGEFLALVSPDWAYSSQFHPAFPAMGRDETYGVPFQTTSLITAGATATVLVPSGGPPDAAWTQRDFVPGAGWTNSPLPMGYGVTAPGFYIEARASSSAITTTTIAEQVLGGVNALDKLEVLSPTVNFTSAGYNDGHFENGVPPLHGEADNFAVRASARILIPETAKYTFHVRSDDGFVLRLNGSAILQFSSVRNPADSFVTRDLTAGEHLLVLTYFANTGDDELELSAAKVTATTTTMTDAFRLIGDTANGGLAVLAPSNPLLPQAATNLQSRMKGISPSVHTRVPFTLADPAAVENLTLSLTYSDGFIAYLNGVEVARSNVPAEISPGSTALAARPALESLASVRFNLSHARSLLVAGANVLAVHGLNAAADDDTFLLAPTLAASWRTGGENLFFSTPTPGAVNPSSGFLGHVAVPSFSPSRGFLTAPAAVTLTSTAGATIRYTTNGSTPTATTGTVYTGPVTVDKTTVLRAAAFLSGYASSTDVTHTYIFPDNVIAQPAAAPAGWPAAGTTLGQRMDYAMDTRIVNHANPDLGGPEKTKAALLALPTVSLTTDLPNLFDSSTGIYNHATNRGRSWERRASMELIAAPGQPEPGFQINFGVRMRGGYSRSGDNPKHSFRAFFRREYGEGKLRYPIFPGDPSAVTEFDKIDIQCSQNYSWSFGTSDINANHNALREIWARDAQLDLRQPSTRGRFVHLYLNGVYWGLYQFQERAEANWAASYMGGNPEDYDIVKNDRAGAIEATDGYYMQMPDGSDAAWKKMWTATRASYFINSNRNPLAPHGTLISTPEEKLAAYFKLQGLLADGRTPSGEPALLDVDNLIDYYILIVLTRNSDSGLSLGGQSPNNFYTARSRAAGFGFISVSHDGEHSMDAPNSAERWGPFDSATGSYWNNIAYSNPIYFHQDMFASLEYRLRFADRIYKHFHNNGPLSMAANKARLTRRADEIAPAIVAESARWGDSTSSTPRTLANWRTARDSTLNFFTNRSNIYLSEARSRGYYPSTEPPVFNVRGGTVEPGSNVTLTNPNAAAGVIYYTMDGRDPRPAGGGFASRVLLPEFSPASWLVPSETNGGSALQRPDWTQTAAPPNAAAWTAGPLGYGFNPAGRPATTNFDPFIRTNVQAAMQPPGGTASGSLYVRVPFTMTAEDIAAINGLRLRVRYDDAYIAYLNGQEVARKAFPSNLTPQWNSLASTARADATVIVQEETVVSGFRDLLVAGENILSFHVMNQTAEGTDLLFSPEVVADVASPAMGRIYTGPLTIDVPAVIKTRVLTGTVWSALNEAAFTTPPVPASASNIVISEFHYAPAGPQSEAEAGYEGKDFEFIELLNIGTRPTDLTGAAFTIGIGYVFPDTPPLAPGARLLLVANPQAFIRRYGVSLPVAGTFTGSLNNAGETVRLTAADGTSVIKEFTYLPQAPWPDVRSSGTSLVLIAPGTNPLHGDGTNWKASVTANGSPGMDKPEPAGYADWKAALGGLADDADPEGDGLTALMEYALGGSPAMDDRDRLPEGGVRMLEVGGTASPYLTLSFIRPPGLQDIDYIAESSRSLAPDSWTPAGVVPAGETPAGAAGTTLLFRSADPVVPGQPLFMRLRVRLKP